MSVDLDIWRIVAEKCVHIHRLRTLCSVASDLATLQCLCKSLSTCASSAWPILAEFCGTPYGWPEDVKAGSLTTKQLKQYLPPGVFLKEEVLQQAVRLQPAQLVVFIQIQKDKAATIYAAQAMKDYRLTKDDLKPLAFQAQHNPHKPSAPCRLYSKQVHTSKS